MPEFLIGFGYHEPEPYASWQRSEIEDYESSTGLWVEASTPQEAVEWGSHVAEALHRLVNSDPAADWRSEHTCWAEPTPSASGWSHCLDFFLRVRVGEMPDLSQMGTAAYERWLGLHPEYKVGISPAHDDPGTISDKSRFD
jgi:hypothetical protein